MSHRRIAARMLGALVFVSAMPAQASEIAFGAHDIPTTFFISKSDDKNRVDYGIHLDESCAPAGDDAVFFYWRVFENAPPVRTKPLSFMDKIPYGISAQRAISRTNTGGEYSLRLKQFDRPIVITTKKAPDGTCSALTSATIHGANAQLVSVFAKLAGIMSVDYIDVFGKSLESGADIRERIKK